MEGRLRTVLLKAAVVRRGIRTRESSRSVSEFANLRSVEVNNQLTHHCADCTPGPDRNGWLERWNVALPLSSEVPHEAFRASAHHVDDDGTTDNVALEYESQNINETRILNE